MVVCFVSTVLKVVADPRPLYIIAAVMVAYNSVLALILRNRPINRRGIDKYIIVQMILDQISLTLLLLFSCVSHNPFIFYFAFHMIIGAILLRGKLPYVLAGLASVLVGTAILLQYFEWLPVCTLEFPHIGNSVSHQPHAKDSVYLAGLFLAFVSTMLMTVYFTCSVQGYALQAQAEVRQKEKMLGIGQLVAGLAHQISNPLDGIQNCLRTIGKHVTNDAHLSRYVDLMTEALDRIERTAKRVQTFARPHGLKLQDTDVNRAVQSALEIVGSADHSGVELVTDLRETPMVMGDTYTLQEVIFNLCVNALAAMPGGGKLTIRTFPMDDSLSGQKMVAVEVADTGEGIPEEHLEKVFEPFFTTRASEGGTGLGLGLCRMLISEMGGSIEVNSVVGKGTVFRITLNATGRSPGTISHEDPHS